MAGGRAWYGRWEGVVWQVGGREKYVNPFHM